jgi:hypothetical protein
MNQTKQSTKELIRQWLGIAIAILCGYRLWDRLGQLGWHASHSGEAHREIVAKPTHFDNQNA